MTKLDLDMKVEDYQEFKYSLPFDPDSSPEAFKYYRNIYPKAWTGSWMNDAFFSHSEETNDNGYGRTDNRYMSETIIVTHPVVRDKLHRIYVYIRKDSHLAEKDKLWSEFKLGGDTDFNFNDKKIPIYYNILSSQKLDDSSILKKAAELKTEVLNFHKNQHVLINMSLMPTSGSMNILKGGLFVTEEGDIDTSSKGRNNRKLDRQDTLLTVLQYYYNWKIVHKNGSSPAAETKENLVLKLAGTNREPLQNFLDMFVEAGDSDAMAPLMRYCQNILLIDNEKLVKDMVENGTRPIFLSPSSPAAAEDAVNAVETYINLAKRYQDCKRDYIRRLLKH
ncbi:hypothetical protein [Lacticaseibacillus suihuaensis]